mmetsp:Transcript_18580/g.52210  ORF Transcript_18580/g.52210 Transcript_18580/m.52210 type:complete len:154 (-) Transcript_18580:763-1224(-)
MVSLNHFLLELCIAAWAYFKALQAKAAFLVCSFLCSPPKPPLVNVHDVRANRIRLNIKPQSSSVFNKRVEQHEIEWAGPATEGWVPAGANNLPQRTVARLQPCTDYRFRVRAVNPKGLDTRGASKDQDGPRERGWHGPRIYLGANTHRRYCLN